ncbi:AI-2E family transporter YdiK [Niveibacterium sp. SC-1]|uniref:AI-2E family transporter YdiK n=1 Tax=Niveibacterium sp. SC-1 TaxID=3135646 RepID=UPI00311DE701
MDTQNRPASRDIARITLSVLLLGLLIAGSLWILSPFLPALIWASMIVVATWPLMRKLEALFKGRRLPAMLVMTLGLLFLIIVPLVLAVSTVAQFMDQADTVGDRVAHFTVPAAPTWVEDLPLVGSRAAQEWNKLAGETAPQLAARLKPYGSAIGHWVVAKAGSLGLLMVHFLLTLAIAAILYMQGEAAAEGVRRFGRRIAGARGESVVTLAAQAVRAVALGIVVTALLQSTLSGLVLLVAGLPYVGVLTSLIFMLCLAQLGPILVLLPVTAWLFYSGQTGWGVFAAICTLVIGAMDNVVRPILIRRGADLPMLLILSGVIGGLFAFGIVGLFVGPVLLAVTYTLLETWVAEMDPVPATPPGEPPAALP